jgi:hypothetical protein
MNTLALLDRLKAELPEISDQAQVIGNLVWIQFTIPPLKEVRAKLKDLGFYWNGGRKCWQHPCAVHRRRSGKDPQGVYPGVPATVMEMRETPPTPKVINSKEYTVVALRECALPESMHTCETPENAADYWRLNISTNPYFSAECECFAVLLLNTRRRVKGRQVISIGTLDTIRVHTRDVFRGAIIAAVVAAVIMHNLCAAAHTLCHVNRRFVWSRRVAVLSATWLPWRKECYAGQ